MRTASTLRTALPLLLTLIVAASGCLFSTPEKPGGGIDPVVEYEDYFTPSNLVLNFQTAWSSKDADEYRDHILYNSTNNATWEEGSNDFQTFTFYYAEGVDQWGNQLPLSQSYELEVANITRMFSGNVGLNETPGVETIALTLEANGIWAAPPTVLVEGDEWPAGTLQRFYDTDMLVMLKGEIPGSDNINGLQVNGRLLFYVIPVRVNDSSDLGYHKEYRLWKWRDLTDG